MNSTDTAKPAISLVLATIGRTVELEAMLGSLLSQTERDFELVIVDQNADQRVAPLLEPLRQAGIWVEHVRIAKAGSSHARNVGIAHAKSELIGFPDDDCVYEHDVIAKVLAHFATKDCHGIVAYWPEFDGPRPVSYRLSLSTWRRFKDWNAPCFALFFRADRLRSFGPFDEKLGPGTNYGASEETDLLLRGLELGAKIDYAADIAVHHPCGKDFPLSMQQCRKIRLYGRGTGALLVKHRLPKRAIAKGLVSPIIRAAFEPNPAKALLLGLCAIAGRIEGMINWRRQSRTATVD